MSIKKICTLLLLCSFFLPMTKGCSKIELFPAKDTGKPMFSWTVDDPNVFYPIDFMEIDQKNPAFLFILVYLWPLPFVFFQKAKSPPIHYTTMAAELFFCAASIYLCILKVIFVGQFMIGAVVSISAFVGYATATLLETWQTLMAQFRASSRKEE